MTTGKTVETGNPVSTFSQQKKEIKTMKNPIESIRNIFQSKSLTKDEIAILLKTTPEALQAFETAYNKASILEDENPEHPFSMNSRQARTSQAQNHAKSLPETIDETYVQNLTERIVTELLVLSGTKTLPNNQTTEPVTLKEITVLPKELRPELTGNLIKRDIEEPAYIQLLTTYQAMLQESNPDKAKTLYGMFRQGLDILDLDPITYEIIGMNQNSMSHWLPALQKSIENTDFFRIPKTKIVKVPLPLLQLTRCEYESLSPTTMQIVNQWAYEAFDLDETKTYFVKTGTYSSKFDFRNAKVTTPQEVRELGSYLLFIHYQALQMAAPIHIFKGRLFSKPVSHYGVSTTNEWVVREYIEDKENNPCIYHGMPLHTEYRVFIDCDTDEILGISPYWRPDIMKQRFGHSSDSDTPDNTHDYVIYSMHEETLMKRYEENKDTILAHVKELLPNLHLKGQWSLDIMQNKDEFWLIDMATADLSALSDCVPKGRLHKSNENWIPQIPEV